MKPNFFIIGAPRCGTTAMSSYLAGHPKIFFSNPKEPFYFGKDFSCRFTRDLRSYERLFKDASGQHLAIGEGTVYYLYSKSAVTEILDYAPDARFIVMLRNPADLVYSFHAQHIVSGIETTVDFQSAWRMEQARAQGKHIPGGCHDLKLLLYSTWGMLGELVERSLKLVDASQIHFIVYDDFHRDAKTAYEGVLTFLGVCPDDRTDFPKVLENQVVRNPRSHAMTTNILQKLIALKYKLGLQNVRLGMLDMIRNYSIRRSFVDRPRPPLAREFRDELNAFFQQDVEKLSAMLDRDLTHWSLS